jgi:hypothetical protein
MKNYCCGEKVFWNMLNEKMWQAEADLNVVYSHTRFI